MKSYKINKVYRFIYMLVLICLFMFFAGTTDVWAKKAKKTVVSDYSFGSLKYTIDVENSSALVTGSVNPNLKKLSVPASIEYDGVEIPVTGIGEYAFEGSKLTSVKLGKNVKSVGEGAFAFSTKLKKATISDSCLDIGEAAFFNCGKLSKVSFGKNPGLNVIGAGAFAGTAIVSFKVPDTTVFIGDATFSDCASLAGITLGAALETIGNGAFSGCNALSEVIKSENNTNLEVYDNIVYSGDYKELISGAAARGAIMLHEGLEVIRSRAFEDNTNLVSVKIPAGTISIGEGTFMNCKALEQAECFYGVTTIEDNAFYRCEMLKSINIPETVTTIAGNPFKYCPTLKGLSVDENNRSFRMVDEMLATYDLKVLVSAPAVSGIVALAQEFRSVNEYAFCGNTSVKAVKLNKKLEKVGTGAFHDCSELVMIQVENGTVVDDPEEIEDIII